MVESAEQVFEKGTISYLKNSFWTKIEFLISLRCTLWCLCSAKLYRSTAKFLYKLCISSSSKVILIKSYSGLFLWNRIWDVGMLGHIGHFKDHEFSLDWWKKANMYHKVESLFMIWKINIKQGGEYQKRFWQSVSA